MTSNDSTTPEKAGFNVKRVLFDIAILLVLAAILSVLLFRNKRQSGEWLISGTPDLLQVRPGPVKVRPPAVAGQFYPDEKDALYNAIERAMSSSARVGIREVRAVLVPHAGYVYSAEVAAASFREVEPEFRRVFILASNHNSQVDFSGVSIPEVTHYAIPGATIPLSAIVDDLAMDPLFVNEPGAHTMHMNEVELPFLYYLRDKPDEPDFTIVPMILWRMSMSQIQRLAEILERYANYQTLFVFSVDLSHYYPDHQARQLDSYTIRSIMTRDMGSLAKSATDGNQVLLTMLALAKRRNWEPTFLMYRNSGDASGDRERVVGYASIVFSTPFYLTEEERQDLLTYAREVIDEYIRYGRILEPETDLIERHPIFQIPRGVFVTLKKQGELRGCMGDIVPNNPLYKGVQNCAIKAAAQDPRFNPVTIEELNQLSLSISVLDFPTPVRVEQPEDFLDVLDPLNDGVVLLHQGRQSTFLPDVWREIPDPREFLSRLCLKQGSPADCWLDSATTIYTYHAYVFGEEPFLP